MAFAHKRQPLSSPFEMERRRGHVSVPGEKLVNLEATIVGLFSALSR